MAYLRPVKQDELVAWLLANGNVAAFSDDFCYEKLAAALIEEFDLIKEFRTL